MQLSKYLEPQKAGGPDLKFFVDLAKGDPFDDGLLMMDREYRYADVVFFIRDDLFSRDLTESPQQSFGSRMAVLFFVAAFGRAASWLAAVQLSPLEIMGEIPLFSKKLLKIVDQVKKLQNDFYELYPDLKSLVERRDVESKSYQKSYADFSKRFDAFNEQAYGAGLPHCIEALHANCPGLELSLSAGLQDVVTTLREYTQRGQNLPFQLDVAGDDATDIDQHA